MNLWSKLFREGQVVKRLCFGGGKGLEIDCPNTIWEESCLQWHYIRRTSTTSRFQCSHLSSRAGPHWGAWWIGGINHNLECFTFWDGRSYLQIWESCAIVCTSEEICAEISPAIRCDLQWSRGPGRGSTTEQTRLLPVCIPIWCWEIVNEKGGKIPTSCTDAATGSCTFLSIHIPNSWKQEFSGTDLIIPVVISCLCDSSNPRFTSCKRA